MVRYLLSFLVLCCLGCSIKLGGGSEIKTFYVLRDLAQDTATFKEPAEKILIIRDTTSPRFIASQRIIFSRDPSSRGYYQYALWVETPPKSFSVLIFDRLVNTKLFSIVSRASSSAVGDLQLNTEILDFYHDVTESSCKLRVRVELVNLKTFEVIAQKEFSQKVSLKNNDASHAVEGFDRGITEILNQIVSWLAEVK